MTIYSLLMNWSDGDAEQGHYSWAGEADSEAQAVEKARDAMEGFDAEYYAPESDDDDDSQEDRQSRRESMTVADVFEGANQWAAPQALTVLRRALEFLDSPDPTPICPDSDLHGEMTAAVAELEGRGPA